MELDFSKLNRLDFFKLNGILALVLHRQIWKVSTKFEIADCALVAEIIKSVGSVNLI